MVSPQIVPNATITPLRRPTSTDYPVKMAGAVLDANDEVVESTLLRRGPRYYNGPPELRERQTIELPEADFGGFVEPHFGHFLLESLARAHHLRESERPIIFQAARQSKLTSWQEDILRLCGIAPTRVRIPKKSDYRVSKLFCGVPGSGIGVELEPEWLESIGRHRLLDAEKKGGCIWLSRSKLNRKVVSGEEALEDKLRSLGWQIVHPQEHPIGEQLSYWNAGHVAGFAGSAFHSVLLASGDFPNLTLLQGKRIPRTYMNIAEAKGITQTILQADTAEMRPVPRPMPITKDFALAVEPEIVDRLVEQLQSVPTSMA